MNFRFEQPASFYLLWIILLLGVLLAWSLAWRWSAMQRFASAGLWRRLAPHFSRTRPRLKAVLLVAALTLLVIAMADPRWGSHWQQLPRKGIDVFFVLDVSKSMLAQDVKPSRLERAKLYIRDMLAEMSGDRVGLIAFAGDSSLSVPLTTQYGAFKMVLDEVGPQSVTRGGTLIGDAIRKAADSFVDTDQGHKAIVVFTDGEDQDSFPLEAAKEAYAKQGIRVYTVGLGDALQGSPIPIGAASLNVAHPPSGVADADPASYMQYDGKEVKTKMNPRLLQQVALSAGGGYILAGTQNVDLGKFYRETLGTLEKRDLETGQVEKFYPQFQWFLAPALLLLLAEVFIRGYNPKPNGKTETVTP